MPRFYILRHRTFQELLFAGFKPGVSNGVHLAQFLKPEKGQSIQVNVIHEDDVKETEEDLRKYGIEVDRVQVA